jgi:hypothetical protein
MEQLQAACEGRFSIVGTSAHAEATNYFAKNQAESPNAAKVIPLRETKNGVDLRATPICD